MLTAAVTWATMEWVKIAFSASVAARMQPWLRTARVEVFPTLRHAYAIRISTETARHANLANDANLQIQKPAFLRAVKLEVHRTLCHVFATRDTLEMV